MDDRLYRSTTDRILTGVAGGLAERMNVDPSLVRVVWVLLAIFSGGIFALIYLVMAVVVPERPGGMPVQPTGIGTSPGSPAGEGSWIGPDGQPVAQAEGWTTPPAETRPGRPGLGAIVGGGILILIGLGVLVDRYLPGFDTSTLWPIVAIVLGIGLVALAFIRPPRA